MSNLPDRPRQEYKDIPIPKFELFINKDFKVGTKKYFQTPEDYDKYIEWVNAQRTRIGYYKKELEMLCSKSKKPSTQFPDKYLWRRLIDLSVEIEWWHLTDGLEKELITAAKSITCRSQRRF